jgi:class 3 adenylate cyclase
MSESVPTQQLIGLLNDLFSAFDLLTEKHGVFKAETIGDAYIVAAGHEGQAGPSDATLRVVEFGLEMLEKVKTIRPPSGMQLQIRVGIHTGPAYSGVVGTKVPKYSFFGDSELVCVLEVEWQLCCFLRIFFSCSLPLCCSWSYTFLCVLIIHLVSPLPLAVNTSARMETMGIPGCINISTAARHALVSEVAACRNGRSIESWLGFFGASIVQRDPVEVKGKGMMDMYLLCPRSVPPQVAKRLSSAEVYSSRASFVASMHGSSSSLKKRRNSQRSSFSRGSSKMSSEVEGESSAIAELEALKREHERLQRSEGAALAEVESLQLSLAEATAKLMDSGRRASQESSLTSPLSSAMHASGASSSQQSEELKLQLLVTTKSLMRARQAILDKEAEIDEMELDMQRLRARSQGSRSGDNLTNFADAMSVHTRRSTFLTRTQNLLDGPQASDPFVPPVTDLTRQGSVGNLSSIGLSQFNGMDLDDLDEESEGAEHVGRLKS